MSHSRSVFVLLQVLKVTNEVISGLCCHGNVHYMVKNDKVSYQDIQKVNSGYKQYDMRRQEAVAEHTKVCTSKQEFRGSGDPIPTTPWLILILNSH